jgi:uncharacterized protein (TIGR02145 family)
MTRRFTLLLVLFLTIKSFAQSPQKFSYQTVLRNSGGQLLANQQIAIKISILQGSETGIVVFSERHTPNTNANGLASLQIGGGTVLNGNFANINWAQGPYFISTETDPNGGNNYSIISTQQLLSVPYALYAETSGSSIPGPQGPAGPQGPQGEQGLTGSQGPIGLTGAQGPQGEQGPAGPQGPIGQTGVTGPQGQTGATGAQGPTGLTGPVGATGSQGPIGLIGAAGPQGPQGEQGPAGNGVPAGGSSGQVLTNCNGVVTWTTAGQCPGTIANLNCAGASNSGSLTANQSVESLSNNIPYTGGGGGTHNGQTVPSTGVTGLTATLEAGTLASGAGSLSYIISGTPAISGIASFALSIGGQTCLLNVPVSSGSQTSIAAHSCGVENVHNANLSYGTMADQQGSVYKTIVIGAQEWMAENLNTSVYRNGDSIATGLSVGDWQNTNNSNQGAWVYYNNNESFACPYGKLYNWYASVDVRQLCPMGWHLPTDEEWTVLTNFLGGEELAGGKMKTRSIDAATSLWNAPNLGGTNSSGFSGVPGGYRAGMGLLSDGVGVNCTWWSSSEEGTYAAWIRMLDFGVSPAMRGYGNKQSGYSVRCIRD